MDGFTIGAVIAQWVATLFVAGGLVYTILHNNSRQNEKDATLKADIKNSIQALKNDVVDLKNTLNDPTRGLSAISDELSHMRENCAKITSGFAERIKRSEEDINDITKRKRTGDS